MLMLVPRSTSKLVSKKILVSYIEAMLIRMMTPTLILVPVSMQGTIVDIYVDGSSCLDDKVVFFVNAW